MGTGDGRAVQGGQVGRLHRRPAVRPQVHHHQLLLGQHHQGIGVIKGWGTGQRSGAAGASRKPFAQPGPVESDALSVGARESAFKNKLEI